MVDTGQAADWEQGDIFSGDAETARHQGMTKFMQDDEKEQSHHKGKINQGFQ